MAPLPIVPAWSDTSFFNATPSYTFLPSLWPEGEGELVQPAAAENQTGDEMFYARLKQQEMELKRPIWEGLQDEFKRRAMWWLDQSAVAAETSYMKKETIEDLEEITGVSGALRDLTNQLKEKLSRMDAPLLEQFDMAGPWPARTSLLVEPVVETADWSVAEVVPDLEGYPSQSSRPPSPARPPIGAPALPRTDGARIGPGESVASFATVTSPSGFHTPRYVSQSQEALARLRPSRPSLVVSDVTFKGTSSLVSDPVAPLQPSLARASVALRASPEAGAGAATQASPKASPYLSYLPASPEPSLSGSTATFGVAHAPLSASAGANVGRSSRPQRASLATGPVRSVDGGCGRIWNPCASVVRALPRKIC